MPKKKKKKKKKKNPNRNHNIPIWGSIPPPSLSHSLHKFPSNIKKTEETEHQTCSVSLNSNKET
jgi:hypothetical protein